MTYYAIIMNNELSGKGQCPVSGEGIQCIEITEEIYNDFDHYMWNGTEIIINPNYEEEQRQKKQKRINNLTMTAWDFVEFLKSAGLTSTQIMAFLNANPDIQLHLTCCQNVYCGVAKSLMPISLGDITITADMVELAFKIKHGEVIE